MTTSFHQATGAAAVADAFSPNSDIKLLQVKFTLSAAGSVGDTLTGTIDAGAGAAYDALLVSELLSGNQNVIVGFNPPIYMPKGDVINFAYPNTGNATWGLEVAYERN